MPTAYYNITNNYVIQLVNKNDFFKLDEYLQDTFDASNLEPISTVGCSVCPSIGESENFEDKIYDILSYATDALNLEVLQYYNKYINNKQFDGNTYTLLHLAIDNYQHNYIEDKDSTYLNVLQYIIDVYIQNNIYIDLSELHYYMKFLTKNTQLLDKLHLHLHKKCKCNLST
jgi:hypothetical protein